MDDKENPPKDTTTQQQSNTTASLEKTSQDPSLFNSIHRYLTKKDINFQVLEHAPTRTSQESANIRNTPLEWGAKTMLVRGVQGIFLLVYRANRKVSWSKLRKLQQIAKKGAMCTEQEVLKLGVRPGGVPPFPQLLGVPGMIDKKFRQEKMVAFNAGLMEKSIIMKTVDYPEAEVEADFTD